MNARVRVCLREERLACAVCAALRFAGFSAETESGNSDESEPPALLITEEPLSGESAGSVLLLYRGERPPRLSSVPQERPQEHTQERFAALRLPFRLEGRNSLAETVRRLLDEGAEKTTVPAPETVPESETVPETSAGLLLDAESGTVSRGGVTVRLSARELALLSYFRAHAGEVVTREALREAVWHGEADPAANVTDVYVSYLRRKLAPLYADGTGAEVAVLTAVRGRGYLFRDG